jgi:hypothetical protein
MNIRLSTVLVLSALTVTLSAHTLPEIPVTALAPQLSHLPDGWTERQMLFLLDSRSDPPAFDHQCDDPSISRMLQFQREQMAQDGRTAYLIVLYGRADSALKGGKVRVYIQRWSSRRALHNRWVDWKMIPTRVAHPDPRVGEDYYWREDCMFQELVFCRGLFNVSIEAGHATDRQLIVELAQAIDAAIRGRKR